MEWAPLFQGLLTRLVSTVEGSVHPALGPSAPSPGQVSVRREQARSPVEPTAKSSLRWEPFVRGLGDKLTPGSRS